MNGGTPGRRDGPWDELAPAGAEARRISPAVPASRRLSLIALFAIAITACEETGARPTTTVQAPDSADQVLEGFSHFVTNQGVRRTRVEADTAYFYESTQITELRNVKVTPVPIGPLPV